jgi:hypothetical protein
MLTVQDITLHSDIAGLPKDSLVNICIDLEIPSEGYTGELVDRIWSKISGSCAQKVALSPYKNRLLCGRTSVTWYRLSEQGALNGSKDRIISACSFNPFNTMNIPEKTTLTSVPVIIGASQGEVETQYYLRFMFKSGVSKSYYANDVVLMPITSVVTVFVDELHNLIEVRTEHRAAAKVAHAFAQAIGKQILLEPIQVLAPFGGAVEEIATKLNGYLIESLSKPEKLFDEFTKEQANSLVNIMSALDEYFQNEDVDKLRTDLSEARYSFGSEFGAPFTALVLSGLDKMNIGVSGRDLRGHPLYDALKPYLQHQGGYIEFDCNEDLLSSKYKIRVGLKTNSIEFLTPATENVLNFVRENVIL